MNAFDKTMDGEQRILNLKSYEILDTRREQEFEDIVLLASVICEVPYCFIGFIDQDRIWFKSRLGLDSSEISLERSVCKYVLDSKQGLLVEDLEADDFFSQYSLIHKGQKICFYFSLPLISPEGFILGTLGVMDVRPRSLNDKQILSLSALNRQIIQNLIYRKSSIKNLLTNKTSALGMFSFSMAHEIKNALFASDGYLYNTMKVCSREENSDKNILNLLHKIKTSNARISKVVEGIKIFCRNAENDSFEIFSAKKIIRETISLCEIKCLHENIQLLTILPEDDFFIECHPSEIIQVLVNLINNSITALTEVSHKWIELEVKVLKGNVEFRVRDGGRGIPPEIAQNLKEIFSHSKKYGPGTEQGLHICKSIIEQHSGEFFFDSNLPTTFGLSLRSLYRLKES